LDNSCYRKIVTVGKNPPSGGFLFLGFAFIFLYVIIYILLVINLFMLKELKQFLFRGNVIDLAVGVVIGAAFGTIVSSLVADIITPLIAAIAKCQISQSYFLLLMKVNLCTVILLMLLSLSCWPEGLSFLSS